MTDEQRLGPPPIESLSDVAWARVERGVWSQLDAERPAGHTPQGPRRWWLAVAPLAAAAAIAALVIALRWRPAGVDEPSRVVSGPGPAPTSVMLGDSHIVLDPDTALVMRHEAEQPTVLIERGGAWFTVAPRMSRPAFIVRAGDATVRVVGTRFRVARSDERIAVEVERGLVDVNFRGSVVAVGAGQRWSSDVGRILAARSAPPASADVQPAPPASAPRAEAGALDPDRDLADPDRTEYDRLAALEPTSPDAALAGYLRLARGTSRWADPALFAAARLAVDRHDRRAETLLGIYLQRFPGGANATDARQLLARVKAEKPEALDKP